MGLTRARDVFGERTLSGTVVASACSWDAVADEHDADAARTELNAMSSRMTARTSTSIHTLEMRI